MASSFILKGADVLRLSVALSQKSAFQANVNPVINPGYVEFTSHTVAETKAITGAPEGSQVFVTNEVGGSIPAFWDGTNWRRVTDRAIIST